MKRLVAVFFLATAVAVAGLCARARTAHAGPAPFVGYLCGVQFDPNSQLTSNYGNSGDITVSVDAGGCSTPGSSIAGSLCTLGASDANCYLPNLYNATEILAQYQALITAQSANRKVIVYRADAFPYPIVHIVLM